MTTASNKKAWKLRPNKFGAVKTVLDGITFDSKAEAKRWGDLKLLERAGEITHLERQKPFSIDIGDKHICVWRADFHYRTNEGSIAEDVKGVRTPLYRLKAKLVSAMYPGVKIVEVG